MSSLLVNIELLSISKKRTRKWKCHQRSVIVSTVVANKIIEKWCTLEREKLSTVVANTEWVATAK